jgi:hypothetical protein
MQSRVPQPASGSGAAPEGRRTSRAVRTVRQLLWPLAPKGQRRVRRLLLLLGLLSLGCSRAAPGPDECVAFAESWLRARRPVTRLEADTAFDELVRRCLTEPYDRELVACVVARQNPERCRVDYARRAEARREERAR